MRDHGDEEHHEPHPDQYSRHVQDELGIEDGDRGQGLFGDVPHEGVRRNSRERGGEKERAPPLHQNDSAPLPHDREERRVGQCRDGRDAEK